MGMRNRMGEWIHANGGTKRLCLDTVLKQKKTRRKRRGEMCPPRRARVQFKDSRIREKSSLHLTILDIPNTPPAFLFEFGCEE